MFSEQRFFAEGNVATDLGFMPHAERLLLQSDFVPSGEPSTHSGRRIAFAVSPHHFAPLFIGRERYGSGNSTLNYSTDVRNVGRAPEGGRGVAIGADPKIEIRFRAQKIFGKWHFVQGSQKADSLLQTLVLHSKAYPT
jgi:hypothetical protein